jgi:class 3 adenylate cyclase
MSLLFADMRGFTRLCQVVNSPERTLQLLDEFLAMLSEQIITHGGVVNKFLGDGVLALFRRHDYAQRAIRCAFAIVERFHKLREGWKQKVAARINFLDVGIGIATDDVILGTVGSTRVRDYTAIGTAVIRAAAFEHCARGGKRILVDHTTYEAIKELIAEVDDPVEYELKKPDQAHGIVYDQYHIKRLKSPTEIDDAATTKLRQSLFISHSKEDRAYVEASLVGPLQQCGVDAWYFEADIIPAEKWVESIAQGLRKSDGMVVVVSKHAAASPWVKEEVVLALSKLNLKDKIISVVLDDTSLDKINDFLISRQAIYASHEENVAERIHHAMTAWSTTQARNTESDNPRPAAQD